MTQNLAWNFFVVYMIGFLVFTACLFGFRTQTNLKSWDEDLAVSVGLALLWPLAIVFYLVRGTTKAIKRAQNKKQAERV